MSYPIYLPTIGNDLAEEIDNELNSAKRHGTVFASLHEAYSVILEEVDEVWDIARQKKRDRNRVALRKELIQLAAMAVKAIHSLDNCVGGTV
jgi:hypothetical protein